MGERHNQWAHLTSRHAKTAVVSRREEDDEPWAYAEMPIGHSSDEPPEFGFRDKGVPGSEPESESESGSGSEAEDETADIPFETLIQMKRDGRVQGYKLPTATERQHTRQNAKAAPRANKHRPLEVTSKKPVPRFREVRPATAAAAAAASAAAAAVAALLCWPVAKRLLTCTMLPGRRLFSRNAESLGIPGSMKFLLYYW